MNVWITKYALTIGIQEAHNATVCKADPTGNMIEVASMGLCRQIPQHFHGKDKEWHTTRDSAVRRANEMVSDKIVALHRQLDRLLARPAFK